jgi:dihydroflavonol-4-reductase
VARYLLAEGAQLVLLARPQSDTRNIQRLDAEIVYGDLTDKDSLGPFLTDCDELYHVAAYYGTRPEDGPRMYAVNVQGTKNLLHVALECGVERVVHTSTIGTIGRPTAGGLPTEDTTFNLWDVASDYVKSKYLGEHIALSMVTRGLDVVVVHPVAPVGTWDIKPSSTGQRIVDYLHGRRPSYIPGGINFCAVQDIAQGHILAARRGRTGERYILGNAQGNLSLAEFLAIMEAASGITLAQPRYRNPLRWLRDRLRARSRPSRGQAPQSLTCNPQKAIQELGLPQTPLSKAFAEAVQWFREHGYVRKT